MKIVIILSVYIVSDLVDTSPKAEENVMQFGLCLTMPSNTDAWFIKSTLHWPILLVSAQIAVYF
jgi:hypothetical protein